MKQCLTYNTKTGGGYILKNFYKIRLVLAFISLTLSILAILGIFYGIKILDFQFTPLMQKVFFDFSIIALVLFCGLILITFLFGRSYCSLVCPFGILQEIVMLIKNLVKNKFKKKNKLRGFYKNKSFKYFITALSLGCLIGGSALIIRYLDPYTIFSSFVSLSLFGIIFTIFVIVLVLFKDRYFCSNICPIGAILGLISKFSIFKINQNKEKCVSCSLCAKNCPVGCIDYENKKIDNERCIKCFKCADICTKGAIEYKSTISKTKESNANISSEKPCLSRRKVIKAVSLAGVLALGYKIGIEFSKNVANKIKNIILPPGAQNAQYMANKCLNCNLCINACPNKILVKADSDFNAVHIDYSKGYKYCDYNCNICSQICPSGAIKKISLKDKQNTRIAMAGIIEQNCVKCMRCTDSCPNNAISFVNDKITIDNTKCIGCGRCASYCYYDALKIYPIKEQNLI